MTRFILRYFIIILIVTLLSSCLISATLISNSLLETTKKDMLYSLKLVHYAIDETKPLDKQVEALNPLAYSNDTRLTIIDIKGQVLADTLPQNVSENHLGRQEIKDAIHTGVGYAQRHSDTINQNMLYVAYYQGDYIIRLSIPYDGIFDHISTLIPGLSISALISFVIAFVLSKRLAYRISKPMIEINEGLENMTDDFRFDLKTYEYSEFNNIVETIENLSHRLRKSMREVKLEKTKIDEVFKLMNEGFVLLDEKNKVLSINKKAITILGHIEVGSSFIDALDYPQLIQAINNHVYQQVVEMKMNHNIYFCYISKMKLGTSLLFVDMTASKKAEKIRSEFFSNVSHELKTPMTSIKGYSDLLAQGYVQEEKQKLYMINKIQDEVNNMSTLINDILMLSRLENMDIEVEMSHLKIKQIVEEVLESYEVEMMQHHIHVDCHFNDIVFVGNYQQILTLFNNLIGNAVKYNKEYGAVFINVIEEKKAIKIVVEDTGIGIPIADQPRIFERFYRVDKGRSRQRGGTGLGLAIVKHIVMYYKGTIRLESELDKGTSIEIVLPQQSMKND